MNESLIASVAVSATRPTSALHGVDVMHWRANGVFAPVLACLFLDGTLAATLTSPTDGTSGVELWGYRLSQWWRLGYINDSVDVELAGNLQGFAQQLDVIGVFERLCIAGTVSAGAATAKLAPIDSWSGA